MELTLRQKIGQLVLFSLDGDHIDPRSAQVMRDYCVGNIIHFGNNVTDFEGSRRFNAELKRLIQENCAGIAPFISIDHEGGRVLRFSRDFTWFPSHMALGAADNTVLTERIGRAMGAELRAAGFNVNFAPVVDVTINPKNPVIGVRSFGGDVDICTRHGAAMARGLQSAGVMACLKHFPGHGDTGVDSHYALPTVDKSMQELDASELAPYRRILGEHGADAVMTTHILFPQIEKERVPATMSPAILTGILRKDIGFDGVIVTDGIQMLAIKDHYGVGPGCVQAVKAGCDLLCIGTGGAGVIKSQIECMDALYAAAVSGELPMERIDDAVRRVLAAKAKYCTDEPAPEPDFAAHAKLNAEACRRAVTAIGDCAGALKGRVLCASARTSELAFGLTHADPRKQNFADFAGEMLEVSHVVLDGTPLPQDYDTLLIGVVALKPDGPEIAAAKEALAQGKRAAFVLAGSPYGAPCVPEGCPGVMIYSLTRQGVQAALDVLTGKERPMGRLPVEIA